MSMSHLSELSIQLRKLQSEKNAQANEIDRLQRQVRIASELKGISISDLQGALKAACEDEAHGELRALVGKLQARVEGLELGGGGVAAGRRVEEGCLTNDGDESKIPTQEQFNQEAAVRARTNLELRIGELEELESALRAELDTIYQNSQKLTERNTYLETQLAQQNRKLEQWELRWKAKAEEEMKKSSIVTMAMPSTSTGSYNYADFSSTSNNDTAEMKKPQPILLHNAPQSEIDAENERRALAAEAALAGERQQRALVQSRLSSAQKSYELKIDQYQHRIQFLEEQMYDLEQQMSSLYAAFGIMQDDSKEERTKNEAWRKTILESDAAMAQEETEKALKQKFSPPDSMNTQRPTPKSDRSRRSLTKMLNPPRSKNRAAVKPAVHPAIAKGLLFLLLDKDNQPIPLNSSALTPRSNSFSARKLLNKPSSRSASGIKFKKQFVVLHGANGLYQIRYGDSYTGPVSGVCEFITAGVSSIEHTSRSSSQQFGFEIMVNASITDAPVLCCAAETEEDFMMWMSALTSVIDGLLEPTLASASTELHTLEVTPSGKTN